MKVLRPVEKIYHFFVGTKNFLYDRKIIKPVQLKFPVVSIGNISFGGVGKTPFIILLAEEFSVENKINIVTKSYKASLREARKVNLNEPAAAALYGDEACLLQSKLPGCSVWSGPDKASTADASTVTQPDLILVDDGFSHRRLSRNFDLVLIDATEGLNDYRREPLGNLKRAHAIVITKSNLSTPDDIVELEKKICKIAPKLSSSIYKSEVRTELAVDRAHPLFIFCGLGRPGSFLQDLEKQGYNIIFKKEFADHYSYTAADQQSLHSDFLRLRKVHPGLRIVTTEKDFVKINDSVLKALLNVPVHRITMAVEQKEVLLEKIRQSF